MILEAHPASAQGVIYSYDSAGRLMKANYGAAGTVTYTYDNAGHLITRVPATQQRGRESILVTTGSQEATLPNVFHVSSPQ
jgi:hypothetical protein